MDSEAWRHKVSALVESRRYPEGVLLGCASERNDAYNDVKERLAFDIEWDILDDNRGGYNLIVAWLIAARRGCHRRGKRCLHMLHRRGAADV